MKYTKAPIGTRLGLKQRLAGALHYHQVVGWPGRYEPNARWYHRLQSHLYSENPNQRYNYVRLQILPDIQSTWASPLRLKRHLFHPHYATHLPLLVYKHPLELHLRLYSPWFQPTFQSKPCQHGGRTLPLPSRAI